MHSVHTRGHFISIMCQPPNRVLMAVEKNTVFPLVAVSSMQEYLDSLIPAKMRVNHSFSVLVGFKAFITSNYGTIQNGERPT